MSPVLRWEKVDTIVRKELAEYRKNRYILISLVLLPVLMCTVLPIVYLSPITIFASPSPSEPLELRIPLEHLLADQQLANVSVQNTLIRDVQLVNCAISHCEIENSTLISCVIGDSNITSCSVRGSILKDCNLWGSLTVNSLAPGSVFVGTPSESDEVIGIVVNLLLMFFVLIPSIIPSIIASYSFVGEKLSKSLEPLLATPTTDLELLAGKTVAIFLPTMTVTWLCLAPTVLIVDFMTEPLLGYYLLPNDIWMLGVFLTAPLFCILSVLINVIISSKVSDVRSSQQIGAVVVLPVIVFFIVMVAGIISLSALNMLAFALVILALDLAVFYIAVKVFRREEILVRWR